MSNQNTCTTENCLGTTEHNRKYPYKDDTSLSYWLGLCQPCQYIFMERDTANPGEEHLPPELQPEPPEENEGWDVCNDVDEDYPDSIHI